MRGLGKACLLRSPSNIGVSTREGALLRLEVKPIFLPLITTATASVDLEKIWKVGFLIPFLFLSHESN